MCNGFCPAVAPSDKVGKKKKTHKKFLKHPLSETSKDICGSQRHWSCETKHHRNDDITFTQRFVQWLHDVRATKAQKIEKSTKNKKTRFF
jgi:hypothetical protein